MSNAVFFNDKKTNDRQPVMTGSVEINGVTYELALFEREARNGNAPWFSVKCQPKTPVVAKPTNGTGSGSLQPTQPQRPQSAAEIAYYNKLRSYHDPNE